MTATITTSNWAPLPGAVPETVQRDRVYVIPTRTANPTGSTAQSNLRYTEHVRFFPKAARAAGLPVEFSMPDGHRKFLSEYSIDPEMWALGIACLTMANDWIISAVTLFLSERGATQGWSDDETKRLPLKLRVAETETETNYEIEGEGEDVLAALRELNAAAKRRHADDA